MSIWYIYPMWHKVSFTLIAEKHVKELKKFFRIQEIDELTFPHITPHSRPLVFVHPCFYILMKYGRHVERFSRYYKALIGVDVADSDRISKLAVSITNYCDAMIVPSHFARNAYVKSGVKVPVHVVPHGLDDEWYNAPKRRQFYEDLWRWKEKKKGKLLLFFMVHSDYRKGADLVMELMYKLRRERRDVALVLKTGEPFGPYQDMTKRMGGVVISGWLTEEQKIELYDVCDVYLLFSRGGGFEVCGLEALARGLPVLAPKGGSWEDYMPPWGLVDSRPCDYVLKDNPIHIGRGVEIDVDKALDKLHCILENLDEYRARVEEHKENTLKPNFTWRKVGEKLKEITLKYYET